MIVNVLGSDWTIEHRTEGADHGLEGNDGYTDRSTRTVVLRKHRPDEGLETGVLQDMVDNDRNTRRHELTHAFLFESGLDDYANDETLVSWLAHQFPKMMRAFAFAGGLERGDIQASLDAEYEFALRERGEYLARTAASCGMTTDEVSTAFHTLCSSAKEPVLYEAHLEEAEATAEPATGIPVPESWQPATMGNAIAQGLQEGLNKPMPEMEQAVRKMVERMIANGMDIKRSTSDATPMTIDEVMQHWEATNEVKAVEKREALSEENRFMQEYQPDPEMSILLLDNYNVNGLSQYVDERARRKLLHQANELYRPGQRLEVERMLLYQYLANNNCSQHEIVSVFNTAVMASKYTQEYTAADDNK